MNPYKYIYPNRAMQFIEVYDRVISLRGEDPRDVILQEIAQRSLATDTEPEHLGSGGFASVYANANKADIVYKIGNAAVNEGYLSYLREIRGKTNKFFPKINRRELYMNENGDCMFLIELERLLPYHEVTDGSSALPERYGRMDLHNFSWAIADHIRYDQKLELSFEMGEGWEEAVKTLRRAKDAVPNVGYDVACSNMMFRPESLELVITDPLA